jgi:DNA-binding PadR family transcriptional regulator
MITSYWGDETTGARRRYYSITPLGQTLYEQNKADWQEAKKLIDSLI